MKWLNKYFILVLIASIAINGCNTDQLTDLNENPNETDEIEWRFLFTHSLVLMDGNRQAGFDKVTGPAAMIQHLAFLTNAPGDKYFRMNGGYFDRCYTDIVKNLTEVINQTGAEGPDPNLVNLHNAARVVRVFAYHMSTDMYGDVPYSEANKGVTEDIYFPSYDHQQDIYQDMLEELSEAAAGFDDNGDNMGVQDLIYRGDLSKWRKFSYSLMLRLAMRISSVDPTTAQLYINQAIQGGVFQSNADNAFIPMEKGPDIWTNSNGVSRALTPWDGTYKAILSNTVIDFLRDHNDPRLMILSSGIGFWGQEKVKDPVLQRGMPNGKDLTTILEYEGDTVAFLIDTTYSRVNELLLDYEDPVLVQTYAEVEFLLAEAAINGWHDGDPTTHYNKGVRAAMQMYDIFDPSFTVSDDQVEDYLATNPFNPNNGREMIGTQYWVATFLNFYETWSNWRRTGFPDLVPVNYPGNVTGGTIPRRIEYSRLEAFNNIENYNAAADRIGGDFMTTRVWWDGGK